jgi:Skp family chaperone for outer membrane proteins
MKIVMGAIAAVMLPVVFSQTLVRLPLTSRAPAIAFINTQRILTESADARHELARFQAVRQQKGSELRTKQQALESTRQELAKTSDPAKRVQLQQQEQQQRTELERAMTSAQTDLLASQRQLQTELRTMLKPVLDDLLKGTDTQLVLNADTSVVWAAPGLDLSSAVIQRLNTKPAAEAPKR